MKHISENLCFVSGGSAILKIAEQQAEITTRCTKDICNILKQTCFTGINVNLNCAGGKFRKSDIDLILNREMFSYCKDTNFEVDAKSAVTEGISPLNYYKALCKPENLVIIEI